MNDFVCPALFCDGTERSKSGIVNGRQRYRCKKCGHHYTVLSRGLPDKRDEAISIYLNSVDAKPSMRAIGKKLGVSGKAVARWIRQAEAIIAKE